jgi:hypothetical protein
LNPVHGGIVEQAGGAGSAFVMAEAFDGQAVGQVAGFDDGNHLDLAAFRARERFRYQCFF